MKKFLLLFGGIAMGLFASKQIKENPKAQAAVAEIGKKAKLLGAAVQEGYVEREAQLTKKAPAKKPAAARTAKPAATRTAKPAAAKTPAKKPATKPAASNTDAQ
ncbi:MAG: hypothetical protein RLZZ626_191 [Actinomycetota bacterium]